MYTESGEGLTDNRQGTDIGGKVRIAAARDGEWNNFHTHTYRCKHATGDVEDYARRAVELGMTRLGMSDHAHVRGEGDHPMHMNKSDLPGYVAACRQAAGQWNLQVLCGTECDYDPEDEGFFRDYYLGELGMDYLVGSVHEWKGHVDELNCFAERHFGPRELKIYAALYVKLIESGIFAFCAHPDLFGRPIEIGEGATGWNADAQAAAREILEAAKAHDAVLEMNTSGIWKTNKRGYPHIIYPREQFWAMAADYGIRTIVNTDAHSVERLDSDVSYAMALVDKYRLQRVELA